MDRRSLFGFIALNVVVTFLVAFLVIGVTGYLRPPTPTARGDLLRVVITATPDPNETPPVIYIVVTATAIRPGGPLILPTPEGTSVALAGGTPGEVPTLDPAVLPPSLGTVEAPTLTPTDPSGCPTHTIAQGEFPGVIAQRYGVSVNDLLRANNLSEADARRLQIGQRLIIPLGGCGLQTATPTITPTPTTEITDTPPPTSTVVPTVATTGARLEVVQVISPGDITAEGIELRNVSGGLLDLRGWAMEDRQGNRFVFPELQMFEGRRVIIYTRAGTNGPLALFWGLSRAIFSDPSQRLTITDADGILQLTYTLSERAPGANVPTPTVSN